MRLKTYVANNMKEALASVRAELGPEAVIISSQRAKAGGLLVRAALDDADDIAALEDLTDDVPEQGAQNQTSPAPIVLSNFEERCRDTMVRRIRGEPSGTRSVPRNFDRGELLGILHGHRAPERLAHALAETAEKSGLPDMTLALASALDMRMPAAPIYPSQQNPILLFGPNGAGKTAVAAKIAAHARLAGRHVVLIAADADGAGAVARLETFAKHLEADCVIAGTAESLDATIATAIQADALAIIDTAGFDPRTGQDAPDIAAKIPNLERIGVLSATIDAEEASEIAIALKDRGAGRLIVTGIDLARRLGALLAAATRGVPLAHVTRSPFVAGGLETLSPLSLARILLQTHSLNPDRGSAQ